MSEHVERRLAAILAADVVGSCRLMGADEEGTLAQLKSFRKALFDPNIVVHRGRVVKNTGDGALVEFASVVDAVRCAVEVQRGMAAQNIDVPEVKRLELRIGIHLGDIIIEEEDIFGDGVNIAVRLEGFAAPGGICISDDAHRQIRGKVDIAFQDMGVQSLKNIIEPMRVWRIPVNGLAVARVQAPSAITNIDALTLPDKPSIAILPFQNMSGDPEQEYFADGMVDEIITALSRFKFLFVIARSSSFTYKGRTVDIKKIGRELGVRYVLEGSVRNAAGKVRIIGQLIDVKTGVHLWADRFEGNLGDVFALQDRMTEGVVSAIAPRMFQTEIKLAAHRTNNLSAYDFFLRAIPGFYSMTREGLAESLRLLNLALELDPRFGFAASLAALCHTSNLTLGWEVDRNSEIKEATRLLRLALNIDEEDPEALAVLGCATAYLSGGDFETAIELTDRAVGLNPNSSIAWNVRGLCCRLAGQHEEAIRSHERAIRLSPLDPMLYWTFTGMGLSFMGLGRFSEAAAACKKALRKNPTYKTTYRVLAGALAHLGRGAEAKEAVARLLELEPNFRISVWVERYGRWPHSQLYIEGLRKAGLPE
jgi:adenylate cyclase